MATASELRSRARINGYGAIVGTATASGDLPTTQIAGQNYHESLLDSDSADTFPVPTSGLHGVLLVPLQLRLLNGLLPDFDGNVPTALVPAPAEMPTFNYDNDEAIAFGSANLGALPINGTELNHPAGAYFAQTLVAAQAPFPLTGIQYKWKRYVISRSYYIKKITAASGAVSWYVTKRFNLGTIQAPHDDSHNNTGFFSNTNANSINNEFYYEDTSGLVYSASILQDGNMTVGSFILNKKCFTYQVNVSMDGANWFCGPTLPVRQTIVVQYQSTSGTTAMVNWIPWPTVQAGNVVTVGVQNPAITPQDVSAILPPGSKFTIDPNANN
jgi:hypothetical protein